MLYCPGCGSSLDPLAPHRCGNCGANLLPTTESSSSSAAIGLSGEEKAGICIGNICLSPLLGIILYFVWKDEKPKKADDVCSVTIFAVILGTVLAFLLGALGSL